MTIAGGAARRRRLAGTVTLHERYIYRDYLQIACVDLTRAAHPALWFVLWDPTQETATRPLALQKDGSWFTYGHDLTKNVWEVFGPSGYIRTSYDYAPFGAVTATGDVSQPFQWSSEFCDSELDLVYYNYRHYSPTDGRWLSRDPTEEQGGRTLYAYAGNCPIGKRDILGEVVPAIAVGYCAGISTYALYAAAAALGLSFCACLQSELCRKAASRIACEAACETAYRSRCALCDLWHPIDETANKFCKKEAATAYALCLANC